MRTHLLMFNPVLLQLLPATRWSIPIGGGNLVAAFWAEQEPVLHTNFDVSIPGSGPMMLLQLRLGSLEVNEIMSFDPDANRVDALD